MAGLDGNGIVTRCGKAPLGCIADRGCSPACMFDKRRRTPGLPRQSEGFISPATLCLLGQQLANDGFARPSQPIMGPSPPVQRPCHRPQTSQECLPSKQSASQHCFGQLPAHRCFSLSTGPGHSNFPLAIASAPALVVAVAPGDAHAACLNI